MTSAFGLHCVNNTCDAKKLPKLNPIPPLRPHLSSSVSKACNSKSKQTENSCKRSVTASASSVMQSACASCKQQTRFDTLIYSAFPCAALRTLWEITLQKFRKSFAHQKILGLQHKRTRLNSVSVPCLQIRVGRFDSGPRLQLIQKLSPERGYFFGSLSLICWLRQGGSSSVWMCSSPKASA